MGVAYCGNPKCMRTQISDNPCDDPRCEDKEKVGRHTHCPSCNDAVPLKGGLDGSQNR